MSWLDKLCRRQPEEPEKPIQRLLFYSKQELENEFYAVVRITWFDGSKVCAVNECKIDSYNADVIMEFSDIVGNALRAGADVSIICIEDPANLGFEEK
mgnify:FL=1|tara:strand:+ start:1171 stop:1464 length:294 start_codon:yes stop_codon:yes gene_type:complete